MPATSDLCDRPIQPEPLYSGMIGNRGSRIDVRKQPDVFEHCLKDCSMSWIWLFDACVQMDRPITKSNFWPKTEKSKLSLFEKFGFFSARSSSPSMTSLPASSMVRLGSIPK